MEKEKNEKRRGRKKGKDEKRRKKTAQREKKKTRKAKCWKNRVECGLIGQLNCKYPESGARKSQSLGPQTRQKQERERRGEERKYQTGRRCQLGAR